MINEQATRIAVDDCRRRVFWLHRDAKVNGMDFSKWSNFSQVLRWEFMKRHLHLRSNLGASHYLFLVVPPLVAAAIGGAKYLKG